MRVGGVVLCCKVNANMMCTTSNSTDPLTSIIPSELFAAMQLNLNSTTDIKWQYFGREDGQCFVYPATQTVAFGYDPRFTYVILLTL